jgi:rhodanese-related sulfurtransferase
MINFLKTIFGLGKPINFSELVKNGATIVDVRTKGEYQGGHIKGSINIPLDTLRGSLSKLKKGRPIITCCASGMRSASAKSILKSSGFTEVYNAGNWISLQNKIN